MRLLLLLLACKGCDTAVDTAARDVDLTAPLGAEETRAGLIGVDDEPALFGGAAAEGQVGDFMLINSRVRFVVQSTRLGGYNMRQGGAVIDADVVRPEGQPGRDMVDDWAGMTGLARVLDPDFVGVIDDGVDSGVAWVQATGVELPLEYLTGAVEDEDFLPELKLRVTVDYRLPADSDFLEVTTTVESDDEQGVLIGDLLIAGNELAEVWTPGLGVAAPDTGALPWLGVQSKLDDWAAGVFSAPDHPLELPTSFSLLQSLLEAPAAFAIGDQPVGPGAPAVHVRYYGVGRSLSALTDAWLALNGEATDEVSGVVEAPDGPVAGARVNVLVDGAPYTLALTDADGRFSAQVPAGSSTSLLAVGRGTGLHPDLAEGNAPYPPYAAAPAREQTLASFQGGAEPVPQARGRGVASAEAPLTLGEPAFISVNIADGGPAELRLSFAEGDPVPGNEALYPGRPSGYAALAWVADGAQTFPVEPGSYSVVVHRGPAYELYTASFELSAGETQALDVALAPAFSHEGWLRADPHSHAAPSNDGEVRMAERLLIQAGTGVQLHFGTEHDHIVDFNPLLEAIGLSAHMRSAVACETSPVLRGHLNHYPLASDPLAPNGGAWPWFADLVDSTEEQLGIMRAQWPDSIVQSNHPLDSGMGLAAGWEVGVIRSGDFWTDDIDAIEVLNGGDVEEPMAFFFDLLNRGVLTAPVGVSDAHGHLSASQGARTTYIRLGSDDPADYSPEGLIAAMRARSTQVSRGVFLDMSLTPGETLTAPATLEVEALSASWVGVDRLILLRDGEPIETVEGTSASFTLDADEDASFAVMAEGDASMSPVYGDTPWALSSPILLDLDGDGWDPPLPPLVIE